MLSAPAVGTLRRPDARFTLPAAVALAGVGLQIAYPLAGHATRTHLAVLIVGAFGLAGIAHAAASRGRRVAGAVVLTTAVLGFAVEQLGVHTGFPFGAYRYTAVLGPRVFGVPPIVGLAWTMLAWPAAVAARRLVAGRVARVLVGAWALAVADLFLDPQLVSLGGWTWQRPSPHLPGVADVPLTNYAGWLLVALVVSAAVQAVAGDPAPGRPDDAVPVVVYLWLWAGWGVAQLFFLDLAASAAWGVVGMGTVAVPLALTVRR